MTVITTISSYLYCLNEILNS